MPCLLGVGLAETVAENSTPSGDPQPARFGDYELLDDGKEGGMGKVYRARQMSLNRIVALKVIRAGTFASPKEVQRFRAEAEAVASLDHPHIVPIHEIGERDGCHYFTMKWLEGGSLADALRRHPCPSDASLPSYGRGVEGEGRGELRRAEGEGNDQKACQSNQLNATKVSPSPPLGERAVVKGQKNQDYQPVYPPRRAAELLSTVTRAVHHAHQRGIIHRDLKPSNILLDQDGQPHVADFGLAKRLSGPEFKARNTELTLSGDALGTPAYMAPEQASGKAKDVTTAADVYALGVMLYELLTGQRPFAGDTPAMIIHNVLTAEPKRPSTLVPKLPRDIETVCLKCLEKDPTGRYGSAEALAAELERFLRHEPIHARRIGRFERAWRWCQRSPALAASFTAAVLLLISGSMATTTLYLKETAARRKAEKLSNHLGAEISRSVRVADTLKQILRGAQPSVALGRDTTLLLEILDRSKESVMRDLKDEPGEGAAVLGTIAESYLYLGEYRKAEAIAQAALRLMDSAKPSDFVDRPAAMHVLGEAYLQLEQDEKAVATFSNALAIVKQADGTNHQRYALMLSHLANSLRSKESGATAEALLRESLAIQRRISTNADAFFAQTLSGLGKVLQNRGDLANAEATYRESLAIFKTVVPESDPRIASALEALAWIVSRRGDFQDALALYQESLDVCTKVCGEMHPSTGGCLCDLAHLLVTLGDSTRALPLAERALTITRESHGPVTRILGARLWFLGDALHKAGETREGERLLRESLSILRKARMGEELHMAAPLGSLVSALREREDWRGLAALLAEDLSDARKRWATNEAGLDRHLMILADALNRQDEFDRAEPLFRELLEHSRKRLPPNHDTTLWTMTALSGLLSDRTWLKRRQFSGPTSDAEQHRDPLDEKALISHSLESEALAREALAVNTANLESNTAKLSPRAVSARLHSTRSVLGGSLVSAVVADTSSALTNRAAKLREGEALLTGSLSVQETNRYSEPKDLRATLVRLVRLSEAKQELFADSAQAGRERVWRDKLQAFDARRRAPLTNMVTRGPPSIPARSTEVSSNCVDLTAFYTARLNDNWHSTSTRGNDLAPLLSAPRTLHGTEFDLRGIVQLGGREIDKAAPGYPKRVSEIPLDRVCRRLYFLHGTGWGGIVTNGTVIGSYRLDYTDGNVRYVPIVVGEDVAEWQYFTKEPGEDLKRAKLAWHGRNARGYKVRLYLRTWENPRPEVRVKTVAFFSSMTVAAPFLVALTAQP